LLVSRCCSCTGRAEWGRRHCWQRFADRCRGGGAHGHRGDGETIAPENLAGLVGRAVDRPGVVLLIERSIGCVVSRAGCGVFSAAGFRGRGGRGGEPAAAGSGLAGRSGLELGACGCRPALLEPAEAGALLQARGVCGGPQEPLLGVRGGHPLALGLLAESAAVDAGGGEVRVPGQDVIEALLSRLVGAGALAGPRYALESVRARLPDDAGVAGRCCSQDADVLFGCCAAAVRGSRPGRAVPARGVRRLSKRTCGGAIRRRTEVMARRVRDHLLDQNADAAGKFSCTR